MEIGITLVDSGCTFCFHSFNLQSSSDIIFDQNAITVSGYLPIKKFKEFMVVIN